jgi:phage terminase large subunit
VSSILKIETPRAFVPLLQPSRYKGAYGGRGSAKSHFFASMLGASAISRPGLRAVCIREVQRSLRESVKRLVEDKIAASGFGHLFDCQREQTITPGGGIIIYQGMQNHTADSIKSLEGFDIAWFEEAQNASDRSLTILRPTLRKPGSELWFSWNPYQPTDPIDTLLRGDNPLPNSVAIEVSYRDNPWFPDELRSEMEWDRARDPDKYAHVWLGAYVRNSEARVFRNWRVGRHDEFCRPQDGVYYFGADWGFSVDPTVLIRCYFQGRAVYVDREVYKVGCEIDRTPALFDQIDGGMARQWPIVADSARPETISYMKRNGYPKIKPSRKGAGSVEEGVEFLKSHDIVVHPGCRHTIDELTFYSYKTDQHTGDVLPVLEDRKNHVIDALRYAVEGVRRSNATSSTGHVVGLY